MEYLRDYIAEGGRIPNKMCIIFIILQQVLCHMNGGVGRYMHNGCLFLLVLSSKLTGALREQVGVKSTVHYISQIFNISVGEGLAIRGSCEINSSID